VGGPAPELTRTGLFGKSADAPRPGDVALRGKRHKVRDVRLQGPTTHTES